ncbi:MAG: Gfo/Idh/MocA family oxidoreductase [Fidelibacterota bacterium]|nr:MAG: Gfo/Idh/MocA family oxidoreductase [Candidatus Neomarinimicrobiota bacterium]
MKKILNIGMVGCGEISLENLGAIQHAGNGQVTIAMDPNEELVTSFAAQAGCRVTGHFEEVLEAEDVEAVCFCTPHDLHASQGIQAAEYGKHIIMEKPLATTLEAARDLLQACAQNNVELSVPYIYRYHENIIKARELVRSDAIGKIVAIEIHWIGDKPDGYWMTGFTGRGGKSGWRKSKERSGGGVLMMNCSHFFDYIEFITGFTPVEYAAIYDTFLTEVEVEDYFVGVLRYDNGALCSVLAGSKMIGGRYSGEQRGTRFYGEFGQIVIGDKGPLLMFSTKGATDGVGGEWQEVCPTMSLESAYGRQTPDTPRSRYMRDFAAAILEGREPPITGESAYRSLETVVRLYESGIHGGPGSR